MVLVKIRIVMDMIRRKERILALVNELDEVLMSIKRDTTVVSEHDWITLQMALDDIVYFVDRWEELGVFKAYDIPSQ